MRIRPPEWVGEVQERLQTVDEALDEFLSLDDLNKANIIYLKLLRISSFR